MPNQTVSSEEKTAIDNPEIRKQKEENNDEVVEKLKELAVHLAITN